MTNSTGDSYLLVVNKTLHFISSIENSILCINQCRHNGIIISDIPKICDPQSDQAIIFPKEDVKLDLIMHGPVA